MLGSPASAWAGSVGLQQQSTLWWGWKLLGESWKLSWHRGSKQRWEELPALLSGDPSSQSSSCCEQQHHRISLV